MSVRLNERIVSHNLDVYIDEVFHQCEYEYDEFDAPIERKPFGILGIDMNAVFQSLRG